jgi:hypothetical protein
VLSNDNGVADYSMGGEVAEEVTITPTTYIAVTPAASLKPQAQWTSDEPASHGKENSKMSQI